MTCEQKYFDYLSVAGDVLQERIGRNDLVSKISFWRRYGEEDPDSVVVGCRTMAENIVDSVLGNAGIYSERASLSEKIADAYEGNLISKKQYYKLNELRKKGNRGAHNSESVKIIDAKMALELLDDILRSMAAEMCGADFGGENRIENDSVFLLREEKEISAFGRDARLAASLSGDDSVEKEAEFAVEQVTRAQHDKEGALGKIAHIVGQIDELLAEEGVDVASPSEEYQTLFGRLEGLDALYTGVCNKAKDAENVFERAEKRTREILDEHDYIRMLLRGKGSATDRQFEVMAFPRAAGGATRVLQISGGAGTGKTLCLIAKLIMDVRPSNQGSLFPERPKRGLFVCFNKSLAAQARALIGAMPEIRSAIEVVNFDRFVNQLVCSHSTGDYRHLNPFAQDARFPSKWKITYSEEDVGEAMSRIAVNHPGESGMYYLDSSDSSNVSWVKDEIEWLEARYESPQAAVEPYKNQMAERRGRGKQRLPRQDARGIILEIWEEYARLLEAERCYTLPQAVKRLLRVSDLPVYDSIAVDEVQDLSINSLRLLFKMRAGDEARVYLSGDENQKIYQRDFTWKELGEGVRGHTISLSENKRNSPSIEAFANRLLGRTCDHVCASDNVYVLSASAEKFERLVRRARAECPGESIAVIGNLAVWDERLGCVGLDVVDPDECGSSKPGLYLLGEKKGKGLEFDTVIIDCAFLGRGDEEEEKRVLYVNCTRARKRLYLRYEGEPPEIIKKYYPDFLSR